jgi:fructokinase
MSRPAPLYGAIEAGGTKFECAVAHGVDDIVTATRVATTTPGETFEAVLGFFAAQEQRLGPVESFGIAAFGPLDLDPQSNSFGRLLRTPKAGWSGVDFIGSLRARFAQPVAIDTDVNAAALGEFLQPPNRQLRSLLYVTVGTGIGGGFIGNDAPRPSPWHAEMGHIAVVRHPQDTSFAGVCPFHRDCLEGMASGPAILARWGQPMSSLLGDPLGCEIIGGYLGQLAAAAVLLLAPERIIFGGGVMAGGALMPYVRRSLHARLGGYISHPRLQDDLDDFIVMPALAERSGICGAIELALRAAGGEHAAAR